MLFTYRWRGVSARPGADRRAGTCDVDLQVDEIWGSWGMEEARLPRNASGTCGISPPSNVSQPSARRSEKGRGRFDLPIAMGLLVATGQLQLERVLDFATIGELPLKSLSTPVKALPWPWRHGSTAAANLLVPYVNAEPSRSRVLRSVVHGVRLPGCGGRHRFGKLEIEPTATDLDELFARLSTYYDVDFTDVRGQKFTKRALVVSASGGHNVPITPVTRIRPTRSSPSRVRGFDTINCSPSPLPIAATASCRRVGAPSMRGSLPNVKQRLPHRRSSRQARTNNGRS